MLATAAVLIPTTAAALGLLFTVAPSLKPCLGQSGASFTGAPVFPRVSFHDHLNRINERRQDIAHEPNLVGAEVRYSYRTSDLRHSPLRIMYSLVEVERDGTVGPVVPGEDRALAMTVTPASCAESGGQDLFLQIPVPHKRYRAILELFRDDKSLTHRLDLRESAPFRG